MLSKQNFFRLNSCFIKSKLQHNAPYVEKYVWDIKAEQIWSKLKHFMIYLGKSVKSSWDFFMKNIFSLSLSLSLSLKKKAVTYM